MWDTPPAPHIGCATPHTFRASGLRELKFDWLGHLSTYLLTYFAEFAPS